MSADYVKAPAGTVKNVVVAALADAKTAGRELIVYVGAPWCEPCETFREALEKGRLPASLASLRVLKFDSDVDQERLQAAGYGGEMIPRFVVPMADGRASAARFEGSVKGPGTLENIVPRLEALLASKVTSVPAPQSAQ